MNTHYIQKENTEKRAYGKISKSYFLLVLSKKNDTLRNER